MKNKGFTLIELLVVIAIIGILASVILASLNSARMKARDAKRVAELQQIQTALELYYDDHGSYPVGGAGSDRPCWVQNDLSDFGCNPLGPLTAGKYFNHLPYDPGANTYVHGSDGYSNAGNACDSAQFYSYWSDGATYVLGAVQESKKYAGCTQVGNWSGPTQNNWVYNYYIRQGA